MFTPGFAVRFEVDSPVFAAALDKLLEPYPVIQLEPGGSRWRVRCESTGPTADFPSLDIGPDAGEEPPTSTAVKEEDRAEAWRRAPMRLRYALRSSSQVDPASLGFVFATLAEIGGLSGWHLLHAAAFGRHGRALVLPAPSGRGKSTLFRHAASRGWELLSDDLVWLGRGDRLVSCPRGAPFSPAPRPTRETAVLAGIVVPTIADRATSRLSSLDGRKALGALLEAARAASDGESLARRFRDLAFAASRARARVLEAGGDGARAVDLLEACLEVDSGSDRSSGDQAT